MPQSLHMTRLICLLNGATRVANVAADLLFVSAYPPRAHCRLCARDAADLMAAVVKAVATSHVAQSEATEIGKVIDSFVKAYQTAQLTSGTWISTS